MNRKMKMMYDSPWMECMQIEAEGTFASSMINEQGKGVIIEAGEQDYASFEADGTWSDKDGEHQNITWE